MRRIIIYILFMLLPIFAFSQKYNFVHFSLNEGLSQSQIYATTQSPEGDLWFGTLGGAITIYDGINTKYLTTNDGLPDYRIWELFTASDGKIWIGTATAIAYFDGYRIVNFDQSFDDIKSITEDANGTIWFSSDTGIYFYKNEKIEHFNAKVTVTPSIYCDSKNNIWFYSDEGISVIKNGKLSTVYPDKGILGEVIFEDSNGNVWFGTMNSLVQFNQIEFKTFTTKNGLPGNSITDIIEDKDGNLWISTEKTGISIFDGHDFLNISTNEGLGIEYIPDLYRDMHNNIWVGTDGDGAYLFKDFMFKQLSLDSLVNNDFVMCVYFDHDKNLWIGTDGGGVVKVEDGVYKTFTTQNGLLSDYIYDIIEDHNGNMWFASLDGFCKYDGSRFYSYITNTHPEIITDFIMSLMEDKDGNIWIGTNGGGMLKLKDDKIESYNTRERFDFGTVWDIFQAKDESIYFATDNGLIMFSETDTVIYSTPEGLFEPGLSNIFEDKDGIIWLATDMGISRFDGENFMNYTRNDGLSSDICYFVNFDANGYLISGTENGIDKLKFNDEGEMIYLKHFGKEDGFFGIECNMNAVINDEEGNMYIGTIDGVTIYNPFLQRDTTIQAITRVTSVKLFYEDIDWLQYSDSLLAWSNMPVNVVLPYNKNNLTFYFIGIEFQNSTNVRYQFKLEGFDEYWMPLTDATDATYSNIPPGEYIFKVKSITSEGVWSNEAEFSFVIKKPFWQTILFYIIIGIILILSIHFLITLRTKRLKWAKIELQNKVNERTAEILQQKEEIESQRDELDAQRELAVEQRDEIIKQKKKVTDSIIYAKRIQNAIFPQEDLFIENFAEHFIFFRPRDIVSGDFYWIKEVGDYVLFAVADCTGHGVPGAFMSLLGISFLNEIVVRSEITQTTQVLEVLRTRIKNALKQKEESVSQDGMDIAICCFNKKTKLLQYSGGNISLYYVSKDKPGEIQIFKADRQPIGIYVKEREFHQIKLQLSDGDKLYLFSDGVIDQLGGETRSKFYIMEFRNLLSEIVDKSMAEQKETIVKNFDEWKGSLNQLDDVLVLGLRI
ncbi:MAG: SpoIIE family protein phosphatase [Bacteroidales bacterium]|nr:SpoIIE family protein phosphatase [Bacteroidales bacterium]